MPKDLTKLCIHTITTKPWPLETAIHKYAQAGVKGITIWREALEGYQLESVRRQMDAAGLTLVSLCRGGFFPSRDERRRQASLEDNLKALDQAAALGAPLLVLVPGADPGQPLRTSRDQIRAGVEAILPRAEARGVKLGIEPLHPMYADTRSAINTLKQANDLCEQIGSPFLGVIIDVYHLWWDPDLQAEINRCGEAGRLLAFHVCDWRTPTRDILHDRELMGEGCIPLPQLRAWVEASGFDGYHEVEIFSDHYWNMDQDRFLENIKDAYLHHA
jgi:sugar phosphate isomerase/epimerase